MLTKAKSTTPAAPPAVCQYCNKPLKKGASVKAGCGKVCAKLAAKFTPTQLQAHMLAQTASTVPANYVPVASVSRFIRANAHKVPGCNVNRFVTAMGRDKGINPAAHPSVKPVYVNGQRYVHQFLASIPGMQAIATQNWDKAPKAGK